MAAEDLVQGEQVDELEAALAETEAEVPEGSPEEDEMLQASPVPDDEVLEDDAVDTGDTVVPDDFEDSMEGSLRLKRLLSRDSLDDGPANKKRKGEDSGISAPIAAKTRKLMTKWALQTDGVIKHILEHISMEELDMIDSTNFKPDTFHMSKSPSELLARQVADMQARKLAGGASLDCVGAFKFRFKIDIATEKALRALSHRELRYIFEKFDGTKPMAECIAEAGTQASEDDDPDYPENVLPDNIGPITYGRFTRLELIDPIADACVFGDANLTFSLRLAAHRTALGHVGRVIATTFEDLPTLVQRYPEVNESIAVLESQYAEVFHEVDCTRIGINPQFEGLRNALGAVYYNFPHSGAIGGFFDGHPIVNWRHENLMRLFFRALRAFVKPGGLVKVTSSMGATGVRYSYIVGSAIQNEFVHAETMPFLEWHLHRYGRSYGDKRDIYKRPDAKNNQSYNAQNENNDMVYCFRYAPTGAALPPQEVRMPPSLTTLLQVEDGPFRNLGETAKMNLAKQLHKRFVTEVGGTHVG